MSILSELGFDYSNEMFRGAMFIREENTHVIDSVERDGSVHGRMYSALSERGNAFSLDHEQFPTWSSFAYPPLGYRCVPEFNALAYVTKRNSPRRGLHIGDVTWNYHVASVSLSELGVSPNSDLFGSSPSQRPVTLMRPEYTNFKDGLAKMMAGDIPFFAMSAWFAVAPADDIEGAEILYRRRRIGTISPEGRIRMNLSNKLIASLWEKETSDG